MPRQAPGDRLAIAYEKARAETLKREHRRLTAKEYLDAVDPSGKRNAKSARDYIRRVAKGERTGKKIVERADRGGGQYMVVYEKGGKESSAIVRVPSGQSNLDLFSTRKQRAIKRAANVYAAERQKRPNYRIIPGVAASYRTWRTVGIRPVRETKHTASIVRLHG